MSFRKERMTSVLREVLGDIIMRQIDATGLLITLTDVQISKNFDRANIFISILPKPKEEEIFKLIDKQRKFFRHLLVKKLNWRLIPELNFEIDYGIEQAANVEKILLREKSKENGK